MSEERIPPPWARPAEPGASAGPAADSDRNAKGQFVAGAAGNPNGRPLGSKNTATRLLETLKGQADALLTVAIDKAMDGDTQMLSTLLGRMLPVLRQRGERIQLKLDPKASYVEQGAQVLAAMAEGQLSADEAQTVLANIALHARLAESTDLAERVTALEGKSQRKAMGGGVVRMPFEAFAAKKEDA